MPEEFMNKNKPIKFDKDSPFACINKYKISTPKDLEKLIRDPNISEFERRLFKFLLKEHYREIGEMN
jgi:hypothetical protein